MAFAESMCRCCMIENKDGGIRKMLSVFTKLEQDMSIKELILLIIPGLSSLSRLSEEDDLPRTICLNCIQVVKEFYKFQQNCLNNDAKFQKMFLDRQKKDTEAGINAFEEITINETQQTTILGFDEDTFQDLHDLKSNSDAAVEDMKFICEENLKENIAEGLEYKRSKRKVKKSENEDTQSEIKIESIMDDIKSCSDFSIDLDSNWSDGSDMEDIVKEEIKFEEFKNEPNTSTEKTSKEDNSQQIYKCDKCGKFFISKTNLARHQLLHEPKKFECNVCKKTFRRSDNLKEHMLQHSDEKKYLCPECGRSFLTSSNLNKHMRRHSNLEKEKKFGCDICPKSFISRGELSKHLISHSKLKNLKTHGCDECERSFSSRYLLKKHKMYHSNERNFQCECCAKRFFTNEKLQRHRRIHTGEKPYACKFCEKAYIQWNELTKHLRIHLGENIYQCQLCPQRFPTAKSVKEHFISHKNDDEETKNNFLEQLNALEAKGLYCR